MSQCFSPSDIDSRRWMNGKKVAIFSYLSQKSVCFNSEATEHLVLILMSFQVFVLFWNERSQERCVLRELISLKVTVLKMQQKVSKITRELAHRSARNIPQGGEKLIGQRKTNATLGYTPHKAKINGDEGRRGRKKTSRHSPFPKSIAKQQ